MSLPRFLIAAPSSGSGKTLITCGILQALVNRGLKVASFKCGPDYIDPMFHSRVIGTRSKNLDAYFVGTDTLRYLFARTAEENDISVIDGVMGFYDGNSILSMEASSHDVSRKLDAPVILLINSKGASISNLATLKGFLDFTENNIKGVIFNQMSQKVFDMIRPEVEKLGIKTIGYVPKVSHLILESRHLGLVLPNEIDELKDKLNQLAEVLEESLDIDLLMELASSAPDLDYRAPEVRKLDSPVRIGLAQDDVFCFTYEDNIEIMRRMGAEIVEFSPLNDKEIPDVDAIVLSGGYPELHAEKLCSNKPMMEAIRKKVADGMPCLAECGGFMYLHDRLEDSDGRMHDSVGVIKGEVKNTGKLSRFGYITVSSEDPDSVLKDGPIKGHEFHYWDSDNCGDSWKAVKTNGKEYMCMHEEGNLIAGYPHLYFYSNPEVPYNFLSKAAAYGKRHRLSGPEDPVARIAEAGEV
ncbi:MAG: cobyrinate a,c-diamide synthase, partial [Candidatus Methanomethylophilaceae archaeon]|nr:cobyrinate a,c-diamide synthase [Candidatus Methanomethylophilaceae archaeon]